MKKTLVTRKNRIQMKKTRIFSALIVCLILSFQSNAQEEKWSLERCIEYAIDNSANIKRAAIAIKQSELSEKGAKLSRYPNLNAAVNYGFQFGRSLDFVTNQYVNKSIANNSLSLTSNATIFNGFKINNSVKRAKVDTKAAQLDYQQDANNIALEVSRAYLNILLAKEQLQNARKQKQLTEDNLTQVDKLIEAGSSPRNERLNILARIATDEQKIITQENAVSINLLNLKQLLQMEPSEELNIETPELNDVQILNSPRYSLVEVYDTAVLSQPFIKANQLRLESAQLGVEIAKADLYPSITAQGNLSSNYSNISDFPDEKYFDQLDNNFFQSVGLGLNIPLFNRGQTRLGIERAELNVLSTNLTNIQNRQTLKTDIQRAIGNAGSSKLQLIAAQTSVESQRAAYVNSEKRYNLGSINTLDFTTAKNNLEQAEINLILAKYQYLFDLKIVDFYRGIKLDLK